MKKLCLVVAMLLSVVGCGNKDNSEVRVDATFEEGKFYLDGVIYSLPCALSDLEDNGWVLSKEDGLKVVEGKGYDDYSDVTKGDKKIRLSLHNYDEELRTAEECAVIGISASEEFLSADDFTLAQEVTFGRIRSDVVEVMGESTQGNNIWKLGDIHYLIYSDSRAILLEDEDPCRVIKMQTWNTEATDAFMNRKANTAVIEEDSKKEDKEENDVKEKIELSDSIHDYTLEIEGHVYQMPILVSDLEANGIEVTYDKSDNVPAKNRAGKVLFTYKGRSFEGMLKNDTSSPVPLSESYVYEIDTKKSEKPMNITLSHGITTGSTIEEVIAGWGEHDKSVITHVKDKEVVYRYKMETKFRDEKQYVLTCDEETKEILHFVVTCYEYVE